MAKGRKIDRYLRPSWSILVKGMLANYFLRSPHMTRRVGVQWHTYKAFAKFLATLIPPATFYTFSVWSFIFGLKLAILRWCSCWSPPKLSLSSTALSGTIPNSRPIFGRSSYTAPISPGQLHIKLTSHLEPRTYHISDEQQDQDKLDRRSFASPTSGPHPNSYTRGDWRSWREEVFDFDPIGKWWDWYQRDIGYLAGERLDNALLGEFRSAMVIEDL